jgi:Arc/MetJ-type ribon-helix-helix transcriptional regulator
MVEKEYTMNTITVRLPESLVESLSREALSPDEVIIEALEEWLGKRQEEQRKRERQVLLEKGLIMSSAERHAFVERFMNALGIQAEELPSHDELRQELKGVPPLSELIIAERDEGR